jgi:hypothetical protein
MSLTVLVQPQAGPRPTKTAQFSIMYAERWVSG